MKELNLKFEDFPLHMPNEKKIVAKLDSLVKELEECGSFLTAKPVIKRWNKYMEELQTDGTIISVRYSLDTRDPVYKKAQDKLDEIYPVVSNYATRFEKILLKAKYRKDAEAAFGSYLFKMYESHQKSFDEKIIPELIEENKLTSKYDEIMGGAQIEFRGEVYNTSQLGKFLSDSDRATRKEAAQAFDKWLGEHEQEIADIYDKLVKLRHKMAKELGFKNFVDLGYLKLGRTDYDSKKVAGYREQIKAEVVPVCQKLYKVQMKNLGIKNPQYYDYNLSFKSGNPLPKGGTQDLVNAAKHMYEDMSKESGEFINFMIDHHLMDLEARAGKAPGGYMTTFPKYKAPFIFSNFNGTDGDVNVLTHEGGHAFQGYLSADIKIPEYQSPTLESCEIHSMSMEFFAWPYMEDFFGEDAEKYKYSHLTGAIEFLPYGITIDEFQHWVYEHPEATHEERCAKYLEIERANLPHKKYDDTPTLAKGTWWMRQGHVFGSPFYYIDYTLAQVVAFQFLDENIKNHERAWKKYVKLCKMGGKLPFTGLLEKDHLRNPFEEGNVRKSIKPLLKILKGFDTSKF